MFVGEQLSSYLSFHVGQGTMTRTDARAPTMTISDHDPQIVQALDRLEADLPKIISRHTKKGVIDEAHFWPDFAGVADDIVEHADDDAGYAHGRIDKMLADAGLGGQETGG